MTQVGDQLPQQKRVELILQQLDDLPTLPAVAMKVLEATGDDDSSARDVVKLIETDPALTTRILRLVNSAGVGVRGDVTTIERAVVLLGFEAVRSAVLAVSIFQTFGGPSTGHRFNREEFWKHCVAVACCAELLAACGCGTGDPPVSSSAKEENHGRVAHATSTKIDPSEAFVCGLLHDLGKVALDVALPKSFARVVETAEMLRGNIADLERTVIGIDHMVVGKRLAERWQLPLTMRDCIWLHGQHPQALPATVKNPSMVNLVTLADVLVREQHLGYSGNYAFSVPRGSLQEAIGLTNDQVEQALRKLVEHIEPRAKALGLGETSSAELYHEALARANKELGRVSGQLATKNRRLAVRAKFFDALSGFHGEIRADAPPQTILQAIGQTAVSVLEATSIATFSLAPANNYAEVMLFDSAGDLFENSIVDCHDRPPKPASGDGPVMFAGDDMEWLLSQISPRLAHDRRYWICLEADGACIGGILWGAPSGESERLASQVQELNAIAAGWGLALRTAQIREEARALAEQLAEANRKLQSAQTEILRTKTMITVGEMAAGAAHEMNNPLAVISGRSQLLASQLSDPKLSAAAKLIHEQSHRLSRIITELMDFAKPVPPKPTEVEPADLVQKALYEAKNHTDPADRTIEVTMADVPNVIVDREQVAAALVEVIDNALQATDPKKGEITINGAFDPYSSRVVLTIADNGCGMDDKTLKRAFDPFFSSKPAGRRRGLGLAKALRWIESSGGSMQLESRPNLGTRTLVLLPVAPSATNAKEESVKRRLAE